MLPIPKIQYMLLNLEVFMHASSLGLNRDFYRICLSPISKLICPIVLPWGKYKEQKLNMGVVISLVFSR